MNYIQKYNHLLEYKPNIEVYDLLIKNIEHEIIYQHVFEFIKKYNLTEILISLSGGVDSNVLFEIIHYINLHKKLDIQIHICHINYNNRDESNDEKDFLIEYCKFKNYTLNYIDLKFKRGQIKREEYEKQSRFERYKFYENIIKENKLNGVLLGHHQDDIVENVFNNLMRGNREITDLTVIKDKNEILDVDVYRPMLNLSKNYIYEFAHKYQIPYFLDTTPDWSCRGKMRRRIFPECEECYSNNFKNSLLKIGKDSDELKDIINNNIIQPIIDKIKIHINEIFIQKEDILKKKIILKNILFHVCNKYNIDLIRHKTLDLIINNFDNKIKITLSDKTFLNITDTHLIIIIKYT